MSVTEKRITVLPTIPTTDRGVESAKCRWERSPVYNSNAYERALVVLPSSVCSPFEELLNWELNMCVKINFPPVSL